WPGDCILGNWTGGSMGAYLRHYPRYYGDTPVRDVGLIASEGRMTIPLEDGTPGGVLDVTSHYFEFIPTPQAHTPRPPLLPSTLPGAARASGTQALLHPADARLRPVPLRHPRRGARGRLPQRDAGAGIPQQRLSFCQHHRRETVGVPRHARHGPRAARAGPV